MNITLLFILLVVFAIAVFDVWVILKKGKKESISAHLIRISLKYPLVAFLFGVAVGHILWRMADEDVFYDTKCVTVSEEVKL